MKTSHQALSIAENLNLSEADAGVMELKAKLYRQVSASIQKSKLTHEAIAKKVETSPARITRISNLGENSLSMELLIKIIVALENKIPLKVA